MGLSLYEQRNRVAALNPTLGMHLAGLPAGDCIRTLNKWCAGISRYCHTREGIVAATLRHNGGNQSAAFNALLPAVNSGNLVFSRNANGNRVPLPLADQRNRLLSLIEETHRKLSDEFVNGYGEGNADEDSTDEQDDPNEGTDPSNENGDDRDDRSGDEDQGDQSDGESDGDGDEDGEDDGDGENESDGDDDSKTDDNADEDNAPMDGGMGKDGKPMTPKEFIRFLQNRMRPAVEQRKDSQGKPIDEIGMRLALNAASAYVHGIPFEESLDAYSMNYPDDLRRSLGIQIIDQSADPITPDLRVPKGKLDCKTDHRLVAKVERRLRANRLVFLTGGKGTGKTTFAMKLAERIGLPFGMIPFNEDVSTSWMTGAWTIDGYKGRPLLDALEFGGVFLFDEVAAADTNVLMILNTILANEEFHVPNTTRVIRKHQDFLAIFADNTDGFGGNAAYNARNALDAATLDRLADGRIRMTLDPALEEALFWRIIDRGVRPALGSAYTGTPVSGDEPTPAPTPEPVAEPEPDFSGFFADFATA